MYIVYVNYKLINNNLCQNYFYVSKVYCIFLPTGIIWWQSLPPGPDVDPEAFLYLDWMLTLRTSSTWTRCWPWGLPLPGLDVDPEAFLYLDWMLTLRTSSTWTRCWPWGLPLPGLDVDPVASLYLDWMFTLRTSSPCTGCWPWGLSLPGLDVDPVASLSLYRMLTLRPSSPCTGCWQWGLSLPGLDVKPCGLPLPVPDVDPEDFLYLDWMLPLKAFLYLDWILTLKPPSPCTGCWPWGLPLPRPDVNPQAGRLLPGSGWMFSLGTSFTWTTLPGLPQRLVPNFLVVPGPDVETRRIDCVQEANLAGNVEKNPVLARVPVPENTIRHCNSWVQVLCTRTV
jgi:hypothetical protein